MIPFDAGKDYHKSIRGAIAAGTPLRLRVLLPRSFGVSYCTLLLTKDGCDTEYIPMQWEQTDGIEEWWQKELIVNEPGLYFYRFEYVTAWGTSVIRRVDKSQRGGIEGSEQWQLTVYPPAFQTPDVFAGGLIYQIFPDRFFDSGTPKKNVPRDRILHKDKHDLPVYLPDENGEIRNNDYFCGDLAGITEKLDYIKSLGATVIYLNPIAEAHSNHRYNTADYKKVDPLLGTTNDFKTLCAEAHKKGMKIIIDGVYSHTGDDSVYFNKYGRYPSLGAYQSNRSPYYSWYTFGDMKDDYLCWWNIDTLPEVNESDPGYVAFITGDGGVLDFWLDLGADGVRLDVADELPDTFLDAIRQRVKKHGEDKLLLGEVWEDASNKISHGGRRRYFDGRQLDCVMNYPFRTAIIDFALTANAERFMREVSSIVDHYPPQAMRLCMNLLGTHDTERILTALSGVDLSIKSRAAQAELRLEGEDLHEAKTLLKMCVAVNYALPGIPSLYYGDEAGMTGGKDPFNRGYYPWGEEDGELLAFFREMGAFRKSFDVLKEGGFYPLSAEMGCIAFLRYQPGMKRVAVIANNNDHAIDYRLNLDMRDMSVYRGGEKSNGAVTVQAHSAAILTDTTPCAAQ